MNMRPENPRGKRTNSPMNQYTSFLAILLTLQAFLDELSRPLKLHQQILIIDIIDLDAQMLILLPVLEVLEIVLEDRDYVSDSLLFESGLPAQGENAVSSVSADVPILDIQFEAFQLCCAFVSRYHLEKEMNGTITCSRYFEENEAEVANRIWILYLPTNEQVIVPWDS